MLRVLDPGQTSFAASDVTPAYGVIPALFYAIRSQYSRNFYQPDCCKTGLNVGDKKQNMTFLLLLQHIVAKHGARFCCKRQLLLHDFSSKKNGIFWFRKRLT